MKYLLLLIFALISCTTYRQINDYNQVNWIFPRGDGKDEIKNTDNICVIGDAGHGTPNQALVGKALTEKKCIHVWYVGDVIYPYGLTDVKDTRYETKFSGPYKPLIESNFFKQFHIVLGNHDYKGNIWVWSELAKIHPYLFAPSLYYVEVFKGLCFFTLDSNHYMHLTDFKNQKREIEWLDYQIKNLKSSNSCQATLAFAHHPYISSGFHGNAAKALANFYENHVVGKVDFLITGHDHQLSDEGSYQGTKLLVSGAASESKGVLRSTYQKTYQESKKLGFIVLNLDVKKIQYEFVTVAADEKDPTKPVLTSGFKGFVSPQGLR